MGSSAEPSRIATREDCEEIADLLERFQVEYGESAPGVGVLASRVHEHIAGNLSVFVLAGPRGVGVAQLRFREYLITGSLICYMEALYVVPERRRQGHGRVLMNHCVRTGPKAGRDDHGAGHHCQRHSGTQALRELGVHELREGGNPGDADAVLPARALIDRPLLAPPEGDGYTRAAREAGSRLRVLPDDFPAPPA